MPEYTKPYGTQRSLRNAIRADKSHLANAPLSSIQKKRLQEQIDFQKEELRKVNAYIRNRKKAKASL